MLNRRTASATVVVRKTTLVPTIKADRKIASRRIAKAGQSSAHRWHLDVGLTASSDVDAELIGRLRRACALSA